MKKKVFIEGLSCGHCVNHVKEALSEINGVTGVDVDLATKIAVLEASADIENSSIIVAIEEAGYEVKSIVEM